MNVVYIDNIFIKAKNYFDVGHEDILLSSRIYDVINSKTCTMCKLTSLFAKKVIFSTQQLPTNHMEISRLTSFGYSGFKDAENMFLIADFSV